MTNSRTERLRPIAALQPGESGEAETDAFLRDTQRGWHQDPDLVGMFARVPEGLRGWRRLVEGTVVAIGPVAWELVAHRTAAVTGSAYRTTQGDASVRKQVEALRPAITASEVETGALGKREQLTVALADGVARHEVSAELFQELKEEYEPGELVALCMAASLTHVSHLVSDALGLGPDPADQAADEKSRAR